MDSKMIMQQENHDQINQQITINNNISITTIHNHEQSDKVNQKVQYTASNMPAKSDERLTRARRSSNTGASQNTTEAANSHHQGIRGI